MAVLTPHSPTGGELFTVDNSETNWKGLRYLQEWTEIASAFDIATGYFEIGALLALDGHRQKAVFKPIQITDTGLELIEWLSLDCTHAAGPWVSATEIKIDKKSFVIRNGVKTREFWNGKITSTEKPCRLKIRNIAGDESVVVFAPENGPA